MRSVLFCYLVYILMGTSSWAEVVINEFQAASNLSVMEWNANQEPHIGPQPFWQDVDFHELKWYAGLAPIGVGAGNATNLASLIYNKVPGFYMRKAFTLTPLQAASAGTLTLRIRYDDGFVAYLNGREVARANMGPAKQITYGSMITSRTDVPATTTDFVIGAPAASFLQAGTNVLAIEFHNHDLTSDSTGNASLFSTIASVTSTLLDENLNSGNDASTTFVNQLGNLSNTASGNAPTNSWLATAPAPVTSPLWESLQIVTTALSTGGRTGTGAQRYDFSQSGPNQGAAVFGGPVALSPYLTSTAFTTADLSKLTASFRYRLSPGSSYGFRLQPTTPGSAVLSGTTWTLSDAASTGESNLRNYVASAGGTRTLKVTSAGGQSIVNTSTPLYDTTIFADSGVRGGDIDAECKLIEDNAAGNGAGASTGVLKFGVSTAPVTWDALGFRINALPVSSLPAGTLTSAALGDVALNFAWKLDAGVSYNVYLQPTAGFASRLDFGAITGTGSYESFSRLFAAGTNQTEFLTAFNQSRTLSLCFRATEAVPVNSWLCVDNVGYVGSWRTFSANLGSGSSSSGTQAAFVAALVSSGVSAVLPVFDKLSAAPAAPDTNFLIIDEFKISFSGVPHGTSATYFPLGTSWKYWPGLAEPSAGLIDPAVFPSASESLDLSDWIELFNNGADAVDLYGWGLTDDSQDPYRWTFPAGTTIPAGGYLVVLADDTTTPPPGAQYLHASFSLSAAGEFIGLHDASNNQISALQFPKQNGLHTYGRNPSGDGSYGYLRRATPGTANTGPFLEDYVRKPDFLPPGGFFNGPQTITLSTVTEGAQIRYTLDGSDVSETSPLYTGPLTISAVSPSAGTCIRARAFKAGHSASEIETMNYLIDQSPLLETGPVVTLTADEARALYKPFGVTAIVGGSYNAAIWTPNTISDYNNVIADGPASITSGDGWERPVHLEIYYPDGRPGYNADCAFRVAGSPFTRIRYTLNTIQNAPWNYDSVFEKPSFNLFFRSALGPGTMDFPIMGEEYPYREFDSLRLRGGHNDIRDPFIKDEFSRRLLAEEGQDSSVGIFVPLYVNAKFRGYYNLTERLRAPFMQQHHHSSAEWDVKMITDTADGDPVYYNDWLARLNAYRSAPTEAKYAAIAEVTDLTNLADYLILNVWNSMGDWPQNNYTFARERTAAGKWRCYVWDAEGGFGAFSKHIAYNTFTADLETDILNPLRPLCLVWSAVKNSPEFLLHFADRINRQMCNDGALTDGRTTALKNKLLAQLQPYFTFTGGGTLSSDWFNTYVNPAANDRRDYLFQSIPNPLNLAVENGRMFYRAGVWPQTTPPLFNQHGGDVPTGFNLTINHTEPVWNRALDNPYAIASNPAPVGKTIYYTINGADPRLYGGAINPAALSFTTAVPLIAYSSNVKARIYNSVTSEWSPLTEATFQLGAVSPTKENLIIAEFMYNAPSATNEEFAAGFTDGDLFEWVRVKNIGSVPVKVYECEFTSGLTYDFNLSRGLRVLDAGASGLIVANLAAFQMRYGHGFDALIIGEYLGKLSNNGENLTIKSNATNPATTLVSFTYDDSAPWPDLADGYGSSLILLEPYIPQDPNLPTHWQNWASSALPGGLANIGATGDFQQWKNLMFNRLDVNNAGVSNPLADPDHDGLCNLLEFAFGLSPRTVDAAVGPKINAESIDDQNYLTIEFTVAKGATGLSIEPQVSNDLATWNSGLTLLSTTPNPNGSTVYKYRDITPTTSAGRRYLRVKVTD